jgi:hypothetical protein
MTALMEGLYGNRAPGLPASALADVFDRLVWCLVDNGAALLQVREDWLVSDDRGKVEIALAMKETFPFSDAATMERAFSAVTTKWPDLASVCEGIIDARRKQRSRADDVDC